MSCYCSFRPLRRPDPTSTLFPYTTLFRSSTIDPALPSGEHIPIEERDPAEVRRVGGQQTAPAESPVFNPAFDVTSAALDRKSTRLNSSHLGISYAVFCLKKKKPADSFGPA